jgi:hypothetical protein
MIRFNVMMIVLIRDEYQAVWFFIKVPGFRDKYTEFLKTKYYNIKINSLRYTKPYKQNLQPPSVKINNKNGIFRHRKM